MHQDRVQRNQVNPENLENPGILGNLVTPENLANLESPVNPGNPESLVKDRYQREAKYQTIAKQTVKQHIIAEPLLRKKQIDIKPL